MLLVTEGGVTGGARHRLQEKNRKEFTAYHSKNIGRVMESAKKEWGLKDPSKSLDMSQDGFSIKSFREAAYRAAAFKTREAQSETAFGQLLRAGVLQEFNNNYQAVEVTYDAVVRQVQSNKRQEFFAPLERTGFPKQTQAGEPFPETDFRGLDIELINAKYGFIFAVERELVDDDQTGQIVQRAAQMGENARIHEEAWVWQRLAGVAGSFDGETIPVSATYPTPYRTKAQGGVFGTSAVPTGVNATANGRLSQTQIQNGWILGVQMTDQLGRPMLVKPNFLAVSAQDIFFATILLQSSLNPSSSSTASADIGKTGSINSINPIANLVGIIATRFLPDYAALLIEAGKGFAFQRRDPTEVVQENPQSGLPFSQEVYRYKERSRWVADFIDPRFVINLNVSFASS